MGTDLIGGLPSPLLTSAGLALLGLLPFALVVMTSFGKIAVVLSILRSAIGAQNVPPNTVMAALAVMLSFIVMAPVFATMGSLATPLVAGTPAQLHDLDFVLNATSAVIEPWRVFLAANSGSEEVALFARLQHLPDVTDVSQAPLLVAIPAFAITELAEAFQVGFILFVPFLVIDLLVGSVLLSLGMHMLSPTSVSMPFKLLLFVMINGWILLSENLVMSYVQP